MEDKILISTYAIHSNDPYKIKDLRSFLVLKKESLQHNITHLSGDKLISLLKIDCYFIEEKINTTIAHFQYIGTDCVIFEKVIDKLKDLNILLMLHKEELLKLDFTEVDYLSFKKEIKDAFDFELQSDIVEPKRKLLSNHKEIENEIREFIKIDKSENNKVFDKKVNPDLTIKQIALKYAYEGNLITRENQNAIAIEHNHNTGGKLYQTFLFYYDRNNRKAKPYPSYTRKTLNNKIELFESVIDLLAEEVKEKAVDELAILKGFLLDFE